MDVDGTQLNATILGLTDGMPYTFTVRATNAIGLGPASEASGVITPTNLPPIVSPGQAIEADESEEIVAQLGSFTDPGPTDTHDAVIDWGDGDSSVGVVTDVQGVVFVQGTHTYIDDGQYIVTLTVTDGDSGIGTAPIPVTIDNIPPSVSLRFAETLVDTFILVPSARFTDPGTEDIHTATFEWGDGTVTSGIVGELTKTVLGEHIYQTVGEKVITLSVSDDDGGIGKASTTVTVIRAPATVSLPSAGVWGLIVLTAAFTALVLAVGFARNRAVTE